VYLTTYSIEQEANKEVAMFQFTVLNRHFSGGPEEEPQRGLSVSTPGLWSLEQPSLCDKDTQSKGVKAVSSK
jgi:hypothetical protein